MNNIVISLDETHHLRNGKPLYSHRFDKVQSFHFPLGYAPVIKGNKAFFINAEGMAVFLRNFKSAHGFYNGIASVSDEFGFFHINAQGNNIHSKYFSWSGNFQENACVVKSMKSKKFFHIDVKGNLLYTNEYAYVGDYRYGIAVITDDQGLCTHIDKKGNLLHGNFFLNLDVYHKGYAIAQDEKGYFHINKSGEAIYDNRYLKLEPFYNGKAFAVNQQNQKIILNSDFQEQALYK